VRILAFARAGWGTRRRARASDQRAYQRPAVTDPGGSGIVGQTNPSGRGMDEDWDDVELTVRSWDEPEAFGVVLERHAETLPGYFARRTLDPEATAELTAETFAQAFASRRRSEITGSERSGGCTGSPATSSAASSGTGRWTLAPDAASGWRSGRSRPRTTNGSRRQRFRAGGASHRAGVRGPVLGAARGADAAGYRGPSVPRSGRIAPLQRGGREGPREPRPETPRVAGRPAGRGRARRRASSHLPPALERL
jgi:hypothetical protein